MHYLINIITYGNTQNAAKDNAQHVIDKICGESKPFDWYALDDGRWDASGHTYRADSDKGRELLDNALAATKQEFFNSITQIRKTLNTRTADQIWANHKHGYDMFRYYMFSAGKYCGPGIYAYDADGEGICGPKHMQNALNGWGQPRTAWVTCVDMHS